MRKILNTTLFLLIVNGVLGQSLTIKAIESRLVTHQGVEFVGELKDVKNDHYSFNNWSNEGILYLNATQYNIANINFNASNNSFESRIDRKKIFAYKNANIDSVSINDRKFKKIDDYFFEVLTEKENFYLLKKHDIEFHEGVMNRMHLKEGEGFTTLTYRYLVKVEDDFKTLSLNKKSILSLLETKNEQEELIDYVKKNNLSFKREHDVSRILEYLFLESGLKLVGD